MLLWLGESQGSDEQIHLFFDSPGAILEASAANPATMVVRPALTLQGCIVSYSSKAARSL